MGGEETLVPGAYQKRSVKDCRTMQEPATGFVAVLM